MDKLVINDIVSWIKNYVQNSNSKGVVVGISGGKDSLVVAKLCTLAIGTENVFGVIMPNGHMIDEKDAVKTCELLGIKFAIADISNCYNDILLSTKTAINNNAISQVTLINTAPRIRMTMLYAIAGSLNYLVANTSNLSETMIGYSTKWGDNVGDFAPIADFTKTEVCEIGGLLGLPEELVNKTPSDGLSGKSDEDSFGFSYDELDEFIRTGKKGQKFDLMLKKYNMSKHKREKIKKFEYSNKNYFENK